MPAAVPKPIKGSKFMVICNRCGTNAGYSVQAMNSHSRWCAAAKKEKEMAAKKVAAKARRKPQRR
uniref:Uncharacterized protein n=1 Tax=Zea mays TaxID=4577 RepID=A0A804MKU9_MAIZE